MTEHLIDDNSADTRNLKPEDTAVVADTVDVLTVVAVERDAVVVLAEY
jgi:hypothetical protein